MLTLDCFENKVLVQYERNSKRVPKGVIVAIGPGIVGWSLCNKKDTFVRAKGLNIALRRAASIQFATEESKDIFYEKCPETLEESVRKMINRSLIYFKYPSLEEGGC